MIWLIVAGCLVFSFVFSGIEAGLISVNRVRLHHHARQRERAAINLEALLSDPDRALLTVLLVTNLLNIFAVVLTTREFVIWLGGVGYIVSLLLWLPLYLFFLQLLPKSLFRRFPYRALAAFADLLRVADFLLAPLVRGGAVLAALILPREKREQRKLFVGREDVKHFMSESERSGELTRAEHTLIHNIVDFVSVAARDVMVPMEQVPTIPAEASVEELYRLCEESNVESVPVVGGDGRMKGLVDIFDVLVEQRPERKSVSVYQRRLVEVRPDEAAANVIRKLRNVRAKFAAVVDSGGRPLGIVSAESIIRRLVAV